MNKYHKIQTVFKRDPHNSYKTLLIDEYSRPEFEYLKNNDWVFTEKVDGTNIRITWNGENISFSGKSDNSQIPSRLLSNLNEKFLNHEQDFVNLFEDCNEVCLYGEGYGGKIQKAGNTYGGEQRFVLFDIKIGYWWLQRDDVEDISSKLNLEIVPIIGKGDLGDLSSLCEHGFDSKWGNFPAEGIIARPSTELIARNGQRIITKLKHKDFS